MRSIKNPVNRYFLETNVLRKQDVKGNVIQNFHDGYPYHIVTRANQ